MAEKHIGCIVDADDNRACWELLQYNYPIYLSQTFPKSKRYLVSLFNVHYSLFTLKSPPALIGLFKPFPHPSLRGRDVVGLFQHSTRSLVCFVNISFFSWFIRGKCLTLRNFICCPNEKIFFCFMLFIGCVCSR